MRTFIFAIAVMVPASLTNDQAFAVEQIPAFDIARNCKEATAGGIATVEACSRDETEAKGQLSKSWSNFGQSAKKACIGEASMGGVQSYIELLTCLEMSAGGHFSSPDNGPGK